MPGIHDHRHQQYPRPCGDPRRAIHRQPAGQYREPDDPPDERDRGHRLRRQYVRGQIGRGEPPCGESSVSSQQRQPPQFHRHHQLSEKPDQPEHPVEHGKRGGRG